jgi:hypothetical protein
VGSAAVAPTEDGQREVLQSELKVEVGPGHDSLRFAFRGDRDRCSRLSALRDMVGCLVLVSHAKYRSLRRLWAVRPKELDLEHERAALLELHVNVRRAHFETDVDQVLAHDADEWINVRDAKVVRRRREEDVRAFTEYLDGATYHEWDDIEPPIVSVSADGSLAWMIVNVRVRRTKNGDEVRFRYAGIETFEKRDDRWIKVAEVGTFEHE